MSTPAIAVRSAGLVTSIGLRTASACAALRCRLNNYLEISFVDHEKEPVTAAPVIWDGTGAGVSKLSHMAASAIRQALAMHAHVPLASTPLLLCVAEPGRVGRLNDLDSGLWSKLELQLGQELHADSRIVAEGQTGVASALTIAHDLLIAKGHEAVLIVAADTFVNQATITGYLDIRRLLATGIRAGFIPGEAAGALLVQRSDEQREVELIVLAQAIALESATRDSDLPRRGAGLSAAITRALGEAKVDSKAIHLCLSDANGEAYRFEELALALTRTRIASPLWLAAESVGETGSVAGCLQYAWLLQAQARNYLYANHTLCVSGNDSGMRTAQIVRCRYRSAYRN
ncbi:hypothetical protein [Massilia sp. CCM 8734]|uniref:hypothetical protein n=1 Tax=Massilia sp. CCM 8734 TaxID=2609283 RepID=UPI0014221CE4|nr:hypothetical protein [Massilia sp. CCM 8734]NIA00557.1 hypothetical protein [Massilia sp. CCM 8734]